MSKFLLLLYGLLYTVSGVAQSGKQLNLPRLNVNAVVQPAETWTGAWHDVLRYQSVIVSCTADKPGSMRMEFANDPNEVLSSLEYTCPGPPHRLTVTRKWFRATFTNTSDEPSNLKLSTVVGDRPQLSAPLNIPLAQDADAYTVRSIPATLDLAQGKLGGFSKSNKLGKNSDIDTLTVPEFVTEAGGVYTGFPDAADYVQVLSSNLADAISLLGAHSVKLVGLDENYESQTEVVNLNGLTPTVSTKKFLRMHTAFVVASGVGNTAFNLGTITVRQVSDPTVVFLTILPGISQSNYMVYTVPAGKIGIIKRVHGRIRKGTSASIDLSLYTKEAGMAPRYRRPYNIAQTAPLDQMPYGGLKFEEKTDLAFVVTYASTNNVALAAGFDIVIIDK